MAIVTSFAHRTRVGLFVMHDMLLDALERFGAFRRVAADLATPNAGDDLLVRLAIVGFSQMELTENWAREHLDFVQSYRASELAFEGTDLEIDAQAWAEFACLAVGLLLGANSRGELDDSELQRNLALLPGFMWQHSRRLIARG